MNTILRITSIERKGKIIGFVVEDNHGIGMYAAERDTTEPTFSVISRRNSVRINNYKLTIANPNQLPVDVVVGRVSK